MRKTSLLSLLMFFGAEGVRAQEVPTCTTVDIPDDYVTAERGGFAVRVPAAGTFSAPPLSIDYESGTWAYEDGRRISFQYGFDVDTLEGIEDARATQRCRVQVGGRDITLLMFKTPSGEFAFGFHLPELTAWYPGTGELVDGLTIAGTGPDEEIQQQGRAIVQSLRLSQIPVAATGVYEMPGSIAQGLSVHVAGEVAGLMWGTYDPASGEQFWLTGVGNRPDVAYRIEGSPDKSVWPYALRVTFYRSDRGRFPGKPGPAPTVESWGEGTLQFSEDCNAAELAFRSHDGALEGTVPMIRLTKREGACSRFDH